MSNEKRLYAIRGATCAENTAESIQKNVLSLYTLITSHNFFESHEVVSIQFTVTADLDVLNPATALRKGGCVSAIPLFCSVEPAVKNSLPRTIRMMITVYMENPPNHQYCNGAEVLRPDLACSGMNPMNKKTIWQVTREYAGIAEAGGVKNVARALAEELTKLCYEVYVFIPHYGCVDSNNITMLKTILQRKAYVCCDNSTYTITYTEGLYHGVHIIFVENPIFLEKKAVYTYTQEEEKDNPLHKRASGHSDANKMNVIFQKAVIAFAQLLHTAPDVIHCQDAHTAMIPAFAKVSDPVKKLFERTRFVVSIHNAGEGYRQQIPSLQEAYDLTGLPLDQLKTGLLKNKVEPFLIAADSGAVLSTVSPWYANELLDPNNEFAVGISEEFVRKGVNITGITNGIACEKYDPTDKSKSLLLATFDPKEKQLDGKYEGRNLFFHHLANNKSDLQQQGIEIFGNITPRLENIYFGYHGRIAEQKGLNVLAEAAEIVLSKLGTACFIILGQGSPELEEMHIRLAQQFSGRYVYLRGYERALARQCIAASDFCVLPSYFEPCGLEDFIGQIFGTLPIAHAVGGLQKIIDKKTGFLYKQNTKENLATLMLQVAAFKLKNPTEFVAMIQFAAQYIEKNYGWHTAILEYLNLYTIVI